MFTCLVKRNKDKAIVNASLHLQAFCLVVQQITRENNVARFKESSFEDKVSVTIKRLQHGNLLLVNNTETPTQRFFDKNQANNVAGLLVLVLYYFIPSGTHTSPLLSVLFLSSPDSTNHTGFMRTGFTSGRCLCKSYCETPATSSPLRFIEATTKRHLITSSATHDGSTFIRDL